MVRVGMDRTAVVEMVWKQRNRLYRKQVRRLARFMVHDPENKCLVGDTVRICLRYNRFRCFQTISTTAVRSMPTRTTDPVLTFRIDLAKLNPPPVAAL